MNNPDPELNGKSGRLLIATFVAAMVNGQMLATIPLAIFMQAWGQQFGWSHGEIGAGVTFSQWGIAAAVILAGPCVDRFGPRRVMVPLTLISGLALMSISFCGGSLLLFYAAQAIAGACTPGTAAFTKMLSLWFHRSRGIAIASLGVGAFIMVIVLPPIARWLLTSIGWRQAYLLFGGVILVFALPLMTLFFREPTRPAARNNGEAVLHDALFHDAPLHDAPAHDAPPIRISHAYRKTLFWLLLGSQVGAAFSFNGFNAHSVSVFMEHGLTARQATYGLTMIGVGATLSQLLIGFLLDRIDTPQVGLPFILLSLVGMALIQFTHGLRGQYPGAVLFGCGCGGEMTTLSYMITRFYGVRNFGTIYGVLKPILISFAAPAAYFIGVFFDRTGTYRGALLMCDIALASSAACVALLPPYLFAATRPNAQHIAALGAD
jgi:MFS family permease